MEHDLGELLEQAERITVDDRLALRLVLLRLSRNRAEDAGARAAAAKMLRIPRRGPE
jgi:hypothetical protein